MNPQFKTSMQPIVPGVLSLDLSGLRTLSMKSQTRSLSNFAQQHAALSKRFDNLEVAFFNAVTPGAAGLEISAHDLCRKMAEELGLLGDTSEKFTDVVFIGIGGSSLGPLSVIAGLQHRTHARPRVHFIENPDPFVWSPLERTLNPEKTLVVAIAKSGTTFETLALFKLALQWLTPKRFRSHTVVLTDPTKGDLRAFANEMKLRSLPIHPGIGGRFSIFSPVGLFPMLCAGLDTELFVQGAARVRQFCLENPGETNVIHQLATELVQSMQSHPNHVFMPYSTPLKQFGSWFVQMWGESLGKAGKGFTPLAALGAVDQHSLLQLLKEGPNDKITWFTSLTQSDNRVVIPAILEAEGFEAFRRLTHHSLDELMSIEMSATQRSLASSQRPYVEFALQSLTEESLGAFYFTLSYLTAIVGSLMEINPFDQPGVEEGKIYIRESLLQANLNPRNS